MNHNIIKLLYDSAVAATTIVDEHCGCSVRLLKENPTVDDLLKADGEYCDDYVGNNGMIYKTIKIGTQVWIIENISETEYRFNAHSFQYNSNQPGSSECGIIITIPGFETLYSGGVAFPNDETTEQFYDFWNTVMRTTGDGTNSPALFAAGVLDVSYDSVTDTMYFLIIPTGSISVTNDTYPYLVLGSVVPNDIPVVPDNTDWSLLTNDGMCYYDNDVLNDLVAINDDQTFHIDLDGNNGIHYHFIPISQNSPLFFANLPYGTYTVTEHIPIGGYSLININPQTFTISIFNTQQIATISNLA
jgi:hypothetical protein